MESWSDDRLLTSVGRVPDAFATFYLRYERMVFRYFMKRTGDPELAADLAAETFAAALIAAPRYDAIARRLRCSPSVVRQRVSRGLATLRAITREDT